MRLDTVLFATDTCVLGTSTRALARVWTASSTLTTWLLGLSDLRIHGKMVKLGGSVYSDHQLSLLGRLWCRPVALEESQYVLV